MTQPTVDSVGVDTLPEDTLQTQASNGGLPGLPDSPMLDALNAPDPSQTALQNTMNPTTTPLGFDYKPGKATGLGAQIIAAAEKYLGQPYSWGNLDCSGLVQRAYKAAGIDLPRVSFQQANYGQRVGLNKLRPGDLVAWDNSSRNNGADHIAIWLGNGLVLEADHPGGSVKIAKMFDQEQAWGVRMPW